MVPAPPQLYNVTLEWGDDTPEDIRIADTLLAWLVEDRHEWELWCFSRRLVSRSWPGSTPDSDRRVIRSPQGRGHQAKTYLLELTGDLLVAGVWRRGIEVIRRQQLGWYSLTVGAEGRPPGTILVEKVTRSLGRRPPPGRSARRRP